MDVFNQGYLVVVSVFIGFGKILIGEYVIYCVLVYGQKVFYIIFLKVFFNQKLCDFCDQFGVENVGLMIGDFSVNCEVFIVVMIMEIFCNMFYVEVDEYDDFLVDVEVVVFDECYYMNDFQCGMVWEELIIYCLFMVQLVVFFVIVVNVGQLIDWIEKVYGLIMLVMSDYWLVLLQFSFCSVKGLYLLLNEVGMGFYFNCKVWCVFKGYKCKGCFQRLF